MNKLKSTQELNSLIEEKTKQRQADKRITLTVSAGTCGRARGSEEVIAALEEQVEKKNLGDKVRIKVTGCHGFCEAEPNIILHPQDLFYQHVQPKDSDKIIEETVLNEQIIDKLLYAEPESGEKIEKEQDISFYTKQKRIVLGDNVHIEPTKIDDYLSIGGYKALAKVLNNMTPEDVIAAVKDSRLRGRGGAGFPTGAKWEFTRKAKSDIKYIICNADEGDPGAYMDRSLMEGNPHRVLEGMIIGAYAIGA